MVRCGLAYECGTNQVLCIIIRIPPYIEPRGAIRTFSCSSAPSTDTIEHGRLYREMRSEHATSISLISVYPNTSLSEPRTTCIYRHRYTAFDGPAVLAHGSGSIERIG